MSVCVRSYTCEHPTKKLSYLRLRTKRRVEDVQYKTQTNSIYKKIIGLGKRKEININEGLTLG